MSCHVVFVNYCSVASHECILSASVCLDLDGCYAVVLRVSYLVFFFKQKTAYEIA